MSWMVALETTSSSRIRIKVRYGILTDPLQSTAICQFIKREDPPLSSSGIPKGNLEPAQHSLGPVGGRADHYWSIADHSPNDSFVAATRERPNCPPPPSDRPADIFVSGGPLGKVQQGPRSAAEH